MNKAFGLYAAQADAALIGGITQMGISTGTEIINEATCSEIYARFQGLRAQKPAATLTTFAIASALNFTGLTGKRLGDLTNGLALFLQQKQEGGGRLGVGNHSKYVFNHGLAVPRRLACDHQGHFTLPLDVLATYDGDNDPVVVTHSQNLPEGLTDLERFTLGPVTLADVALGNLQAVEVDFAIDASTKGDGSDIWDTFSSVGTVYPIFRFRTTDPTILADTGIPLKGKKGTHLNTTIYLRKRLIDEDFVPDGTAEHIKLTAAGLAHVEEPVQASGGEDSVTTLALHCKYDGTNDPVVIDTTAAIS